MRFYVSILKANLWYQTYLFIIYGQKTTKLSEIWKSLLLSDPFMTSVTMIAPPSEEVFLLNKESFSKVSEEAKAAAEEMDSDDED